MFQIYKEQEQKQKSLNLFMDVGRRNVIDYNDFPEVSIPKF